jgi:hypothetical protein
MIFVDEFLTCLVVTRKTIVRLIPAINIFCKAGVRAIIACIATKVRISGDEDALYNFYPALLLSDR